MPNEVILVVEDDPVLRVVTQKLLGRLGLESVAVSSGEEAVKKPRAEIAMILMDIGLPGIDGLHATTLIREKELSEGGKHIPIVALTAHSDRESCLVAGMDDFLQKPAMLADLKRVTEKWLDV